MLMGLGMPTIAGLLAAGVLLDLLLGEARRWHRLVGFGNMAAWLERSLNRCSWQFARGVLAWGIAVLPLTALAWLLTAKAAAVNLWLALLLQALLLYFALGLRSLREHNLPIATALAASINHSDVVVVCNPNNPTGATVPAPQLLDWAPRLGRRGGWLVVDEAFADMQPAPVFASRARHQAWPARRRSRLAPPANRLD
jgi:hypothetical protein